MTEEISEVNKEYDPSFFGDIAISSIEDLTSMTGNVQDKKYFDESKFKQILKINLPIDSKSNVIEVIDKIEQIEGVLSASPNYYEDFAQIPNDSSFSDLRGFIKWTHKYIHTKQSNFIYDKLTPNCLL